MYDSMKTTMKSKIQYVFEHIIKNVKEEKKNNIIQQISENFDLINKEIKLSEVRNIVTKMIGLNGKSINSKSIKYWIKRGWTEEEVINLNLITHLRTGKSPMTINFWIDKGFTEEEAKIKIKSQRKCNIEYWINKGFTEEEAKIEIIKFQKNNSYKLSQKWMNVDYKKNHLKNQNVCVEYWINKGFTEEEAKQKLKERQTTFNKKICIEKYGKEKGLKVWQNRQDKWQDTMRSKPLEERERINRLKFGGNILGYSKISQELFDKIFINIKNKFGEVYYATRTQLHHQYDNNEFVFLTINDNFRFLDFYIPELNKCIEFDGDYWHSEKRGNQERDRIREEEIFNTLNGIEILHVKEKDYKENPENVLKECLEFLNDKTN